MRKIVLRDFKYTYGSRSIGNDWYCGALTYTLRNQFIVVPGSDSGWWMGFSSAGNVWSWDNGDSSTWTQWQPGITPAPDGRCAVLLRGGNHWGSRDCSEVYPYVCEVEG